MHLGAVLLGQIQIVLVEAVLGAVPAAHHAATAADAAVSFRPFAIKVGVCMRATSGWRAAFSLGAEEDADLGGVPGVFAAGDFRHAFQVVIRWRDDLIGRHAEHLLCRGVVRRHHRMPVVEPRPLAVVPHPVGRHQQRLRIGDGASAHRVAVQHDDMAEKAHGEEAAQPQHWPPQPATQPPVGAGHVVRCPALALFHDRHAIAFLGQAMRAHRAAKARAHDEVVVVMLVLMAVLMLVLMGVCLLRGVTGMAIGL